LSSLSIDNGTSVFVLMFIIIILGISTYNTIPKEQFPEVTLNQIYINTPHFGNSAVDIENLITRPIEKELQSISGIDKINSTSIQDFSIIIAEFSTDEDIDDALRKVKDAVDRAKSELPDDLMGEPNVFDVDLSQMPIMTVNLSGSFTNDELKTYGEYLEGKIEDLSEISDVTIKGALDREVKIDVDLYAAQARQISFRDITMAVSRENITMSGGEINKDNFRRAIRIIGEFKNIDQIRNLILKSENGLPIYLRDVAEVNFGYQDRTSFARSGGLPVVSLDIIKRKGENLLSASDKIKEIVALAKKERLPEQMKVSIFNDQSIQTRDQVANLENSIIFGMLLVILVLLFFLGIRNATFVGVAIPFSMLLGFIVVGMLGYTLNMMILFGMIMALGMLVDNGIVVIENIYRHRQEGFGPFEAAKRGTGEVAIPIIASTATTLAAFLPLAFWPGLMGSFMKFLPITLIIVLTSSLFVGLVINPVLASFFMKLEDHSVETKNKNRRIALITSGALLLVAIITHFMGVMAFRNLLGFGILIVLMNTFVFNYFAAIFQSKTLPWLEMIYNKIIHFALRIPILTMFGTVVLFILSIVLLGLSKPKVDFFPVNDPMYVNAFIDLPLGKDIEATNMVMKELEAKVIEALIPFQPIVKEVLTQIGENTADPNGPPSPGSSPNKARLTVSFVPDKERGDLSSKDALIAIREAVQGLPGIKVAVEGDKKGPPTGKPINLELKADNIDTLLTTSASIIAFINSQNIGGIEELKSDVELNKPQLIIHIDRDAARRYEISTGQIATEIRTAVFGEEASKYKLGEDEYPIQIRLAEKYRNNIDDLLAQKITFRNPANGRIVQIPISAVASIEYGATYSSIKRKDLQRLVTVYSNIEENYNANEIIAQLKGIMKSYPLPVGVTYEFTGEQEEQAKAMAFLNRAFMIALMAIFFILVAQFNSVLTPVIIVLSIVFSTIGVFLGYLVSGDSFVIIMTGMGIISLAGIVVNNAIVLIDYVEISLAQKKKDLGLALRESLTKDQFKDVIAHAGTVRLRPVLLTAITTILGLLPMALGININFSSLVTNLDPEYYRGGDSADFWAPMSWTVIYGLTFATFLTLIVVPVLYYSFNRMIKWVKGLV